MLKASMHKLSNNESGFSVIEAILLLIIVIAIAGVGYYVYKAKKNTTATYNTTASSSAVAQTSQGQYCSAYGGICFSYPPNWKVSPIVDTLNPPNPHPGVNLASSVSSGNTVISPTWSTIGPLPAGAVRECNTAICNDFILELSQTPLKNMPDIIDVQAVFENKCANCGKGIFNPQEFLVSRENLASYGFKVNTEVQLAIAPFQPTFTITKSDGSAIKEAFEVSEYTALAKDEKYDSLAAAPSWFQLPQVVEAHQILLSLKRN
ncbi:MAG: hypothetical protein JWS12_501 [Candidatus Saccharibacteria bacterium]|nr:hypothetical protein [Candidatus Saccharibacteria bacterium]